MAGHNTTQNRKIMSRAIISALVLWLAFSGVAAAEQLYVDEGGWWRRGTRSTCMAGSSTTRMWMGLSRGSR